MIRRPPRSTQSRSSAASDVYKRQGMHAKIAYDAEEYPQFVITVGNIDFLVPGEVEALSLIHISEPTRLLSISYAVFCLKKKKSENNTHNTSKLHNTHS